MIWRALLAGTIGVVSIAAAQTEPASQPDPMPMLPGVVLEQVREAREAFYTAWQHPQDDSLLQKAITALEGEAALYARYRGDQGWETADAHGALHDLQAIRNMTAAQRAALAAAWEIKDQFNKAIAASNFGAADSAGQKYLQALASIFGQSHRLVLDERRAVLWTLRQTLKPTEALQQAEAILRERQRAAAGDDPRVAESLLDVAKLMAEGSDLAGAIEHGLKAAAIYQRTQPYEIELADCFVHLAEWYSATHDPNQALSFYLKALPIQTLSDGDASSELAKLQANIGDLQAQTNHLAEACASFDSAATLLHRLGQDAASEAVVRNRLARCYQQRGLLEKALPEFREVLRITGQLSPADQPSLQLATAHNNLGCCLVALGATKEALGEFRAAEAIHRQRGQSTTPAALDTNLNIAYCVQILPEKGMGPDAALPLFQAVQQQWAAQQPPNPERSATAINDLAHCQLELKQSSEAAGNFQSALALREALPAGPMREEAVSETLDELGRCELAMNHPQAAAEAFARSLKLRRQLFDAGNPNIAASLGDAGRAQLALGNFSAADDLLDAAAHAKWTYLTQTFPILGDAQKQGYLRHAQYAEQDALIGLALAGRCPAKLALTDVLLRKNMLFEVSRQEQGQFIASAADKGSPQWVEQLHQWQDARRQYATLALGSLQTASDRERAAALAEQIRVLENALRQSNPNFLTRSRLSQVRLEEVVAALRSGDALIEYTRFSPGTGDPLHYAAFVLRNDENQCAVFDLGVATELDDQVKAYRAAMMPLLGMTDVSLGPIKTVNKRSADLYASLIKPLESALTGTQRLYIAPEGWLELFPFEALVSGGTPRDATFLIDDKQIVYLSTGRDLARFSAMARGSREVPRTAVLIGNPDFNATSRQIAAVLLNHPEAAATQPAAIPAAAPVASASDEAGGVPRDWPRVPALQDEIDLAANQLRALGCDVHQFTDSSATEECVEQLQAPQILQIATHGFMLGRADQETGWANPFSPAGDASGDASWANPLLQSMLIMAGANTWTGGDDARFLASGENVFSWPQARGAGVNRNEFETRALGVGDGHLTAYEVTSVNLQGTQFVNLTACDTGLGALTERGVEGLREGFFLAGTRSMTTSLWNIPAQLAPHEAEDFYANWLGKHESRYDAFCDAKRKLLRDMRQGVFGKNFASPALWAGVVYVGDPGDLPLKSEPATTTHP